MAITAHDPADSLLRALGARLGEGGLVHLERLPARPPRYGELTRPLPEWLGERLVELGFDELILHAPGHDQSRFLEQFREDVLPLLREKIIRAHPAEPGASG